MTKDDSHDFIRSSSAVLSDITPRPVSLAAAAGVLVAGFLVLNVLYVTVSYPDGLPGLYSYRSATVGDAILLPLLTYTGVRYSSLHLPWARKDVRILVGSALVGAAAGAATQISWYTSNSTRLNWTIPSLHSFNVAGWYHAAFLTLMTAFLTTLAVALVLRVRFAAIVGNGRRLIPRPRLTFLISPAFAFFGILSLDNAKVGGRYGALLLLPLAAPALAAFSALLISSRGHQLFATALVIGAALLPAVGLSLMLWPGHHFTVSAMVVALGAGFGAVVVTTSHPSYNPRWERYVSTLPVAISLAGPAVFVASIVKPSGPLIACFFLVSVAMGSLEWRMLAGLKGLPNRSEANGYDAVVASLFSIEAAGLYFLAHPARVQSFAPWCSAIEIVLVLAIVGPWTYRRFEVVTRAEANNASPALLSAAKWEAYQAIVGVAGVVFGALLEFSIGMLSPERWVPGDNAIWWRVVLLACGLTMILVYLVMVNMRGRKGLRGRFGGGSKGSIALLLGWALLQTFLIGTTSNHDWLLFIVATFLSVVVALFVAEGVISNTTILHNETATREVRGKGVLSGLAVGLTAFVLLDCLLGSRARPSTVPMAICALVMVASSIVALPYLIALSIPQPKAQYARAGPVAGVLQDAFMSLLLLVFVGWLPAFLLVHLSNRAPWASIVILFGGSLSSAYVFVMHNNVHHVAMETSMATREAKETNTVLSPERQAVLRALREHCRRQNTLALIALLPLTILALALLAIEVLGFKPGGGLQAFRGLLVLKAGKPTDRPDPKQTLYPLT